LKKSNASNRTFVLFLLTLVYGFNFIDRQIVGILAPFIQADLGITNTQLGLLLGFAFGLFYTLVSIPIAYFADRMNRVGIVTISLAVWSGFTALTGLAQNFMHIFLARMGVGVGEAGGSPPSHSIISDLYGKEKRAGALGIYAMGIPLGIMSAYFVSASLMEANPETVDWRRIFIILGLTGIALAILVRLVVREPVRGAQEGHAEKAVKRESFRQSLKTLLTIPSWWFMCFGIATASFVTYAISGFHTKFIIFLDPDFDFRLVVILLGIINGIAYAGGTFCGGYLADKFGKKDVRAYGWISAIAVFIGLPLCIAGFWAPTVPVHLIAFAAMLFFLGIYIGPSFAIAQTLAPVHMRAMSTALFFFIINIIALGGGPTFAGWLIDMFENAGHETVVAIKYAMSWLCVAFLLSVISFTMSTRTLRRDWSIAEARNEAATASEQ